MDSMQWPASSHEPAFATPIKASPVPASTPDRQGGANDDAMSDTTQGTHHTNAWAEAALTPLSKELSDFRSYVLKEMGAIVSHFGGPYQYLKHYLKLEPETADDVQKSMDLRNQFTNSMMQLLPESDTVLYHHDTMVPQIQSDDDMATTTPICFHMISLGYDAPGCSTKDPPGQRLFLELLELILLDGFKTSNEPLLVTQPDELAHLGLKQPDDESGQAGDHPLAVASLGYIKGLARTQTILAFTHWIMDQKIDLHDRHPELYASMLTVYGHHLHMENRIDASMKNMKISCTGSIRKPPNTIGMVSMCQKLVQKGMSDYTEFARRWNPQAPRTHKIQGQKATSMKLLFTKSSPEIINAILGHVGRVGWEGSVWSDDNLSLKRMYLDYVFPARNKKWTPRLAVTKESMMLQITHMQTAHEAQPDYMRKKPTAAEVCELAERAAALYNIGQEFLTIVPIKAYALQSVGLPQDALLKDPLYQLSWYNGYICEFFIYIYMYICMYLYLYIYIYIYIYITTISHTLWLSSICV